ncbi:hypothetical protein [Sphingobacterium anhuiense]|uniref:Uncharacterized protein n=1 Tax=Sphingobacterium anhuiense TaxID=493780 RepID=A0ABW5YV03_9SPHI
MNKKSRRPACSDDKDSVDSQEFNNICLWHSVLEEAIDRGYDTGYSKGFESQLLKGWLENK